MIGFAQQVVCHCVSFFQCDGFLGGIGHLLIIFLHEAEIGQGQVRACQFWFQRDHTFQQLMCFPEFTGLDVKLAQIIQCFEIFFNGQRFVKALNGIVRTSHTLGT